MISALREPVNSETTSTEIVDQKAFLNVLSMATMRQALKNASMVDETITFEINAPKFGLQKKEYFIENSGVVGRSKISSEVQILPMKMGQSISFSLPHLVELHNTSNLIYDDYLNIYKSLNTRSHHLFFERFDELSISGKEKESIALVYQYLDDLIEGGDFLGCARVFSQVELKNLSIKASASFLYITATQRLKIEGWDAFYERVKAHISSISTPQKAEAVLIGLKD